MKWLVPNYWNKVFLAFDGTTDMIFLYVLDEMTGGQWLCFILLRFMCAVLWRICFLYVCWCTEGWLEGNHWTEVPYDGRAESTSWVLICLALDAASRRPILDCDDFGPGWYSWEEHIGPGRLWLHVVQLGGRFWMEMSHCSSLWSVAVSSKAKTLHHLCTWD